MFENYSLVVAVTSTAEPINKQLNYSGRPVFAMNATFTIQGGTTASYVVESERKKKLPDRLASLQRHAAAGSLKAEVRNGKVVSTVTSFAI